MGHFNFSFYLISFNFFLFNKNLKAHSWMELDFLNLFIKPLDNMKLGVILCTLKSKLRISKGLDSLK